MKRWDIINKLVEQRNYTRYLEIGYGDGHTFKNINCDYKVGVDPNSESGCENIMTSDEYFTKCQETFDIIFIDGLHEYSQVKKDFFNSLDILNDGGIIVLHDCNPTTYEMQRTDVSVSNEWTGDVWRLIVELRSSNNELEISVVDTDYGCGVVRKHKQEKIDIPSDIDYYIMDKDRKRILNLLTINEFENYVENLYSTSRN
jgi:hypothetical protein